MRQQVAAGPGLVPLAEVIRAAAVLAGAVVLQADAAQLIAQGQQEIVVVVVMGAIELVGLLDQRLVPGDLLGLGLQRLGRVGKHVELDRRIAHAQVELPVVPAGEQRRILQHVPAQGLELHRIAGPGGGLGGGRIRPAGRQLDAGLDRDLACEVAGRIQRGQVPLQVEHAGRHHHPALIGRQRREVFKRDLQLARPFRHLHLERVHIVLIALPLQLPAIGGEGQAGDLVDLAARAVIAGNPLRVEQGQLTRLDRHRLAHLEDAPVQIGGVHLHAQRARIRDVLRRRR